MSLFHDVRIAVLIKQIPKFGAMDLGPDGRLVRDGLELEMNPYCRRAVGKGVELAAESGGTCTALTLGPPTAEDVLREAVAWGADEGVLITDPAFAGSDTLATARALAAALEREGPFDLVLMGLNSVDANTGQVPPELAELLDLPFAGAVKQLQISGDEARVGCEHDDEWVEEVVQLPAILSCAERLCDPSKKPPEDRAAVPEALIRTLRAGDLGPGPWGEHGSPTTVGEVRVVEVDRAGDVLDGPIEEQVAQAVQLLDERGVFSSTDGGHSTESVVSSVEQPSPAIGVVVEPRREQMTRELVGAAAGLAHTIGGRVVLLGSHVVDADRAGSWGADSIICLEGSEVEEDVARAVWQWADEADPWAILATGTVWGREVASRTAARLHAGLTGDAVGLEVEDGRLLAWKPAFGGRTLAAIRCTSATQMATVRAGVLPVLEPRSAPTPPVSVRRVSGRGRLDVLGRRRDDHTDLLATADRVVAIGQGVEPVDYPAFEEFADLIDAELAATRKVTDRAWMPRARQVGITGHSVAPRLFIAVGASGKFNFMVGARQADTILAINADPDALVWEWADIGIVADWRDVLPLLTSELAGVLGDP